MPISIVVHIQNAEPIVGEIDELPGPGDQMITLHNPRRMDGKDLSNVLDKVITVIWPINKINFIEVLPSEDEEDIIGFVRE
jgi:hypothetical protein